MNTSLFLSRTFIPDTGARSNSCMNFFFISLVLCDDDVVELPHVKLPCSTSDEFSATFRASVIRTDQPIPVDSGGMLTQPLHPCESSSTDVACEILLLQMDAFDMILQRLAILEGFVAKVAQKLPPTRLSREIVGGLIVIAVVVIRKVGPFGLA